MADVIKTGNYTKEDIRVSLKRKTQNAGLFNSEHDSTFVSNLTDMDRDTDKLYIIGVDGGVGTKRLISMDTDFTNETTMLNQAPGGDPARGGTSLTGAARCVKTRRSTVFIKATTNTTSAVQLVEKIAGTSLWHFGGLGAGDGDFANSAINDMAFDSLDNLIVTDGDNDRIQYFNMGAYVSQTNSGVKNYEYVDCDDEGNIYVTDSTTPLVRKFDKALGIVTTWASTAPQGIAIDDVNDKVYVCDFTNGKIRSYNKDGTGGADLITGLTNPVVIATDGVTIAVYQNNNLIKTFDILGTAIDSFSHVTGTGIEIYNNQIYAIQTTSGECIRYDIDGSNVTALITGITTPIDVSIDSLGYIYITESNTDTVLKYTNAGVLAHSWGSTGVGNGQFTLPRGVANNPVTDAVIVVDRKATSRIQEFNYGDFVKTVGTSGVGNLNFDDPIGIAVDADDNTYVVDFTNDRVIKHDDSFTYIDELALTNLTSIDIQLTQERLYIGTNPSNAGVVQIYDLDFVRYSTLPLKQDGFVINRDCKKVLLNGYNLYCLEDDYIQLYNILDNYESTWTDITRFIDMSSDFDLSFSSDESNFSIGRFSIGNLSLSLRNDNDKFSIETNSGSIFFSSAGTFQRNLSKIKVEVNDNNMFEGYIDGKNVKYKQNMVGFTLFANMKYLENIKLENFAGVITDGDSIEDIIEPLIDNLYVKDFVSYTAADIQVFRDIDIDDVSDLPEFILDVIELFSSLGKFSFGLYNGNDFYTYSFIGDAGDGSTNLLDARTLDYIITQNNLLDKPVFNTGEHRLFRIVTVTGDGVTGNYEIDPNVFNIYNEDRNISLSTNSITAQGAVDFIAEDYQFLSVYPAKEIEVIIPLQIPSDGKIYDKQFAFNIFDADGDRGLNINDPALLLGNSILPTKETALDDNNSGERVLYRILGWKHNIGSEMTTTIKIKEMIADDV